jgi:hypothetical protein
MPPAPTKRSPPVTVASASAVRDKTSGRVGGQRERHQLATASNKAPAPVPDCWCKTRLRHPHSSRSTRFRSGTSPRRLPHLGRRQDCNRSPPRTCPASRCEGLLKQPGRRARDYPAPPFPRAALAGRAGLDRLSVLALLAAQECPDRLSILEVQAGLARPWLLVVPVVPALPFGLVVRGSIPQS